MNTTQTNSAVREAIAITCAGIKPLGSLTWRQADAIALGRKREPIYVRYVDGKAHIIPSWLIAAMRREADL